MDLKSRYRCIEKMQLFRLTSCFYIFINKYYGNSCNEMIFLFTIHTTGFQDVVFHCYNPSYDSSDKVIDVIFTLKFISEYLVELTVIHFDIS